MLQFLKPRANAENASQDPFSCQAGQKIPPWFYAFVPYRLAGGLIITLLPLFVVQATGGSVADVGLLSSLTALVGVPSSIWWGNLSDKLRRRRPFLVLGFLGFALSTLLTGLAQNVPQVLGISMLGALLTTAVEPVASALVLDQAPEERWPECIGRLNQVGGWSFVAGLLAGMGWLALLSGRWGAVNAMRGLFLLAGGVASLSLTLTLLWLPEPPLVRSRRLFHPDFVGRLTVMLVERTFSHPSRLRYFVLRPAFLTEARRYFSNVLGRYYLCSLLFFFALHIGFVPFPIFLTDVLGATNTQVFLISLLKSVVDALLYVPMGRAVRRRRGIGLQAQAAAVRVGIFGFFALLALLRPGPASLVSLALVHLLTGVTWAVIAVSGTTAVATLAPKGLEARALGLYNAVIGVAGILGSLAAGYLAEALGYVASFGTAALLMGLTAAWFWRLRTEVLHGVQQRSVQA